eukprot:scaffold74156_cov26-Tisochrysis_lutea.AAC.2
MRSVAQAASWAQSRRSRVGHLRGAICWALGPGRFKERTSLACTLRCAATVAPSCGPYQLAPFPFTHFTFSSSSRVRGRMLL